MTTPADEFAQLAALLAQDPDNPALIADMAAAAHGAGLAAMRAGHWAAAIPAFDAIVRQGLADAGVRFNLAWSLAMLGRMDEALAQLDTDIALAIPQAAQLLVSLLHQRGELAPAMAVARATVARFPDHRGLNAAASTLALDAEDMAFAEETARRAGDHPAALATLGLVALDAGDGVDASALFEAALTRDPGLPRARIGRGLTLMARGDHGAAAQELDRGAALFASHAGSWIAAGWAYLLAGERGMARDRFERARAIDGTFAEAHGGLAVLDLLAGDTEAGRRGAQVALRLDRDSASAALATAMLAAAGGDTARAEQIVAQALAMPIDEQGRTLGSVLARSGTALPVGNT